MKLILIANWKNRPATLEDARGLLTALARKSALYKKLHTFIAPPSVYFESVSGRIKSYAKLASQDMSATLDRETHSGAITPEILRSFGTALSIIGHSERRVEGETSGEVAVKAKVAHKAGITPLVCIGEIERDVEAQYLEHLRDQLKHSLEGLTRPEIEKTLIAYEPIWAIGKKAEDAMTPEDLAQMVVFIKRVLTDLYGRKTAEKVLVIYGGSAEPSNTQDLIKTGVRGFLVGHASLDAAAFAGIAEDLLAKKK